MKQTSLEIVSFEPKEDINLLRLDIQEQIKHREESNYKCTDIKLSSCAIQKAKKIHMFFSALVLFEKN